MTHSKEPWSIGDAPVSIKDASGEPIVILDNEWRIDIADGDLERIVACVNFCRQFPTKFLECRQAVNLPESSSPEDDLMSLAHSPRFAGVIAVQRNE
jgi:hypothetical protein